ncbi:MAG TPA: hypothetical protein VG900_05030 [Hyphomicrobiaceae bacterium]|nr:hypothetical protein [Hyphomicrobiaceae bacterium]
MQGWASYGASGERPGSLAERLAILNGAAYPSDDAGRLMAATFADRSRRRLIRAYFGLGFATSGILGCVALLLMLFIDPENGRMQGPWMSEASASLPVSLPTEPAPAQVEAPPPVVRIAAPRIVPPPPQTIEMPILRAERAMAPFPLRLARADLADPDVRVVLRDVPEAAVLSSGTRENPHTWVLRPADLGDLYLSLGDQAPESFNVKIVVARIAGIAARPLVAHVRLVNGAEDDPVLPPSMRGLRTAAGDVHVLDAPAAQPPRPLKAAAAHTPRQAPPLAAWRTSLHVAAAVPTSAPPGPETPQAQVSRPAGMSALGAIPHEDDSALRRVWWKIPIGSWLPLHGASDRR